MQGSECLICSPSTHTCVQITHGHFHPLVLVCQVFLTHKAQGRACTEPSPCLDVLSWHGSLLQRPQVPPLHFEFISPERIIFWHTQGKKADGSAVAGACSLPVQMKFPFFAFHKAGWREWYLSPLLYQIMSTVSRDSTWSSGILQLL